MPASVLGCRHILIFTSSFVSLNTLNLQVKIVATVELKRANNKLACLRKGSRLLNQTILIGGLLTSQIILSSLAAQAAPTGYDRIQQGCGVGRPFVKGYTTWYGGVNVTNGWADSAIRQWNGSTYVEIS